MSENPDKISENEKMLPEEKLFRVIVAGERGGARMEPQLPKPGSEPRGQKIRRLTKAVAQKMGTWIKEGVANLVSFLTKHGINYKKLPTQLREKLVLQVKKINVKNVNRMLLVLIAGLFLYLVFDLIYARNYPTFLVETGSDLSASKIIPVFQSRGQSAEDVTKFFSKKNVFLPFSMRSAVTSEAAAIAESGPAVHLVGISWDEKGYLAMIEFGDKKDIHFVRKGDSLPEDIKVQEVKNYKVILSQGMRKWELN